MKLVFFVKESCEACKNAREKVDFFLQKWGASDSVDTETINLSTADGLVEAAMRELADVPTIVLEEGGDEVARWTKKAPASEELRGRRIALVGLTALLVAGLVANGCGGGGTGGRDVTIDGPVLLTRTFEDGGQIKYKFKMNTQSGVQMTSYEQTISSLAEFKTRLRDIVRRGSTGGGQ